MAKNKENKEFIPASFNWYSTSNDKLIFQIKEIIKLAKDLIIRSSSAEFLIFERQKGEKGIEITKVRNYNSFHCIIYPKWNQEPKQLQKKLIME